MTWKASGSPGKMRGRRATTPVVSSRSDWRTFVTLARACAAEAEAADEGACEATSEGRAAVQAAALRLMALDRQARSASSVALDRDGGAVTGDLARAFIRMTCAFARPTTPTTVRCALAPVIEAAGAFLDDRLHRMNTDDFQRAHSGRPEVWG